MEPPPPKSTPWGVYRSTSTFSAVYLFLQSHLCCHHSYTHSHKADRSPVVGNILTVHMLPFMCTNHIVRFVTPNFAKGIKRYFFKIPQSYKQEVLLHSFICLPLPYMEGIVWICNIDLYYVTAIFNGHRWLAHWVTFLHIEHQLRQQKEH